MKHHATLSYDDVPTFLVKLRQIEAVSARAMEFAILTAARTGEVIGARWDELDVGRRMWIIPKERMKAGREHRMPLSVRALAIVETLRQAQRGDCLFPGTRPGKPMSNMAMDMTLRRLKVDVTMHGFRSSFRDWAAERSSFPSEVVEMALAHAVGNKVEAAYRRGDLFEKRRDLMEAWSNFCG